MKDFKFLQGGLDGNYFDYIRLRWVRIEIDGYFFEIYTYLSLPGIRDVLADVYVYYIRAWEDNINKQRLYRLLQTKFTRVNVILKDENI